MPNASSDHADYNRRDFLRTLSAVGLASWFGEHAEAATHPGTALTESDRPLTPQTRSDSTALHRLNPVPIEQVVIDDEFWSPKRKIWQQVTIRDCFSKFESDRGGAINNFDKVRLGQTGTHAGDPWMDGLIYEMIRGSSDFLLSHPDPELEKQLDGYIARITAAAATNP